jgi:hypothetical protein
VKPKRRPLALKSSQVGKTRKRPLATCAYLQLYGYDGKDGPHLFLGSHQIVGHAGDVADIPITHGKRVMRIIVSLSTIPTPEGA